MNINYKKLLITTIALGTALSCSSLDKLINGVEPEIKNLSLSKYEIDPGDTLHAAVIIKDGDEPMQFEWECTGGQLIPPTDGASVVWRAPVTGGQYKIKVKVINDSGTDKIDSEVTVRSYINPSVSLTSPEEGSYFTQYQQIHISVSARHDNGIRVLRLFLNDTLRFSLDGHSSVDYQFTNIELNTAGSTKIKIEAEARNTSTLGADSISVNVEGIVVGKK